MKTTLLSSFFLVLSYFTIGQVNFHEIKLGSKYSEQALTEAIEKPIGAVIIMNLKTMNSVLMMEQWSN